MKHTLKEVRMKTSQKLGETKIPTLIIQMSLPAIVAMLVQALYNVVDSIFVARVSEAALTAVSLAFPIQLIIISIFVGIGVGLSSVISRKLGEKDMDAAANAAEHGFFLGLILWMLIASLALFVPRWFARLFTDTNETLNYTTIYITIIMIGSVGRIFAQVCQSILQATGDMMNSMRIQLVGAVTNMILDPILIFGIVFIPAMSVKGAAIATITGQIVSMVYGLVLVLKNKKGLHINLKGFHYNGDMVKQILVVGGPVALMQGLSSIMIGGLNFILVGFGETAVAVLGAYFKLQSFIFMPVFGLNQGIMPILGYNYGAKNKERMMETLKYGVIGACSIMILGTIVFQVFPTQLLTLFKSSTQMTEMGIMAFRIISTGFIFAAISITVSTAFQAIGDAYVSFINSFVRQIVVILPVAYGLSKVIGAAGVWAAFPISEVATIILTLFFGIRLYNKKIKLL